MNVVLDAHMLGEAEGGNETYIAGLLRGLDRITSLEALSITALTGRRGEPLVDLYPSIRQHPVGHHGNIWRLVAEVPRTCRHSRADVVHMTYNAPPWLPCPLVLTVHDVIFRLFPEFFSPRVRILLNSLLPLSLRKARVVITVSEASRRDIERFYPFLGDKLMVIPDAPGPASWVEPDYAAAESLTGARRFILAVGTIQPRKNLPRLIRAYLLLREQGHTNAILLMVGPSGWQSSDVPSLTLKSPYSSDIVFAGYVGSHVLAALYRTSEIFVYPSLHEGFGLPVLEAMACGAPVITSNLSSLPEITGEAALLVNPYSVEDISSAMARLLDDRDLAADLRHKGAQQAALFSWVRTATMTVDAYRRALASAGAK